MRESSCYCFRKKVIEEHACFYFFLTDLQQSTSIRGNIKKSGYLVVYVPVSTISICWSKYRPNGSRNRETI